MDYCPDLFHYSRRKSTPVQIGNTQLGGNNSIRVQSMTNTSTMDTIGCVEQCKRIIKAGADYVRLTAQGVREAENLALIHAELRAQGFDTPLVADIHFNPKAADSAAQYVEKVRINPGNYVDPVKTFRHFEYSEEEYARELQKIRERFVPFLHICKAHKTAVRIGVNHGSLSDRIMSRYGDTPVGMVESCMEFLRICVEEDFSDVVISIKASNTLVMVQAVRLLVVRMNAEKMFFPLHLGVTEAGDGEDGRIKSAVGIGSLLIDGIGDTIRVSLSEDPECEIPVAKLIVRLIEERSSHSKIKGVPFSGYDPFAFHRRETFAVGPLGGGQLPVVITDCCSIDFDFSNERLKPDFIYTGKNVQKRLDGIAQICDSFVYDYQKNTYPVFNIDRLTELKNNSASIKFLKLGFVDLSPSLLQRIDKIPNLVLLLYSGHSNKVAELRAAFHFLMNQSCRVPVIITEPSLASKQEEEQIIAGLDFGPLLLDGFGDGIFLLSSHLKDDFYQYTPDKAVSILFGVLQASRLRMSKTEYISCPGCGRTLYDLQKTVAKIKSRTSHLKGLKIGIMGCIVNGPGEMADADYGYVGAGKGQVSLYKGQVCVERSIPEEEALEKLMDIIKINGDWIDP
jgi:(E)-4-hydroxy-3-methylbut-2-enyl-diphosphate synthase